VRKSRQANGDHHREQYADDAGGLHGFFGTVPSAKDSTQFQPRLR
jgi:hypothetical protein